MIVNEKSQRKKKGNIEQNQLKNRHCICRNKILANTYIFNSMLSSWSPAQKYSANFKLYNSFFFFGRPNIYIKNSTKDSMAASPTEFLLCIASGSRTLHPLNRWLSLPSMTHLPVVWG